MSPTQRSLNHLRKLGYTVAITEHWNPFAHIRQDLFGFIDLVALKDDEILAVQTTSSTNIFARRKKIALNKNSLRWIEAGGRIQIHGWKKNLVKVESYPL